MSWPAVPIPTPDEVYAGLTDQAKEYPLSLEAQLRQSENFKKPECLTRVRVLDVTKGMIIGNWCSSMLSELGADTIKAEPPDGVVLTVAGLRLTDAKPLTHRGGKFELEPEKDGAGGLKVAVALVAFLAKAQHGVRLERIEHDELANRAGELRGRIGKHEVAERSGQTPGTEQHIGVVRVGVESSSPAPIPLQLRPQSVGEVLREAFYQRLVGRFVIKAPQIVHTAR